MTSRRDVAFVQASTRRARHLGATPATRPMTRRLLAAVLLPLLAAAQPRRPPKPAPGPLDATVVAGPMGARLDTLLDRYAEYGFAGTVLVTRGGEVVLLKGYGWAD